MTPIEREELLRVSQELDALIDHETLHDGHAGDGECQCVSCIASRAKSKIDAAVEIHHDSLQPRRLRNQSESVFAETWKRYNKASGTSEQPLLAEILRADDQRGRVTWTQRDATVAACVVQWLGTNCGMGFVRHCLSKIARLDDLARLVQLTPTALAMPTEREWSDEELPGFVEIAQIIAKQFEYSPHRSTRLIRAIVRAMNEAAGINDQHRKQQEAAWLAEAQKAREDAGKRMIDLEEVAEK